MELSFVFHRHIAEAEKYTEVQRITNLGHPSIEPQLLKLLHVATYWIFEAGLPSANLHLSAPRDGEGLLSHRLVHSYHRQLFNNLIKLEGIRIGFLEFLLKSWELTPLIVRNHFLIFSLNLFIARLHSFVLMPTLSFTLNSSFPSLPFASTDKFKESNHIFFSLSICLQQLNELHSQGCPSQIKLPGPLLIQVTIF